MRPMTVKQAQKWLEKLKVTNQNSFKELSKVLKRYEKNSDDYECFLKMNTLLLDHPDLTIDINGYLEEGNKFVINQSQVEKINDLVKYIRKKDVGSFQQIANYITKLHSERRNFQDFNEDQMNKLVRNQVLNEVKGKPGLEAYAHKALNLSADEMIKQLNLSHLITVKNVEPPIKPTDPYPQPLSPPVEPIDPPAPPKPKMFPPFLNQNEEKYFFKQFQNNNDPYLYDQVIKIINIYQLGIISRTEALELLKPHCLTDYAAIKDLIESRQTDRRRNCCFRSLNDIDYSNAERTTHSYVRMPDVYPHHTSINTPISVEVLNKSWVTVPRGTQETFNIRVKNSYQENLIRTEDDRYQFDIYCRRLTKTLELVDSVVEKLKEKGDADVSKAIQKIISLGTIQTLYKNTSKEQREQIEFHLRSMRYDTMFIFQARLRSQQGQLQEMRNIHGLRTWQDVAYKNWKKSLDLKGHQFKRIQKLKMKAGVFLDELKTRVSYLKSRGENVSFDTPFEEKKQFFSILNSFEAASRKERCLKRVVPFPKAYDIKNHPLPTLLPAMILGFEDKSVMSMIYSFVIFFIDNAVAHEGEKNRCKNTFKQIMSQFFGMINFEVRSLSQKFEQQKLFSELPTDNSSQKIQNWIETESQPKYISIGFRDEPDKIPTFNSYPQQNSEYCFEPPKSKDNYVFYASENFYVFVRFFYALFERIIRMKEIADSERKMKLFEILYFVCIKSKQSAKFEDNLNHLFGDHAYLFTTFYKLLQNLQKSINVVSQCSIYSYSFRNREFESEEIYLLLLNRFILNNGMTATRLMRFVYQQSTSLLYINSFDSYYKIEDQSKELQKRRMDITSKIEIYTLLKTENSDLAQILPKNIQRNQIEYCFEGNSIKMINMCFKQDYLVSDRKSTSKKERIEEIKKIKKLRESFV